jgi:hypothetical protein
VALVEMVLLVAAAPPQVVVALQVKVVVWAAVVLMVALRVVALCRVVFSYPTVRQELLSGRREWRWMRSCDGRGLSGAESRGQSSRCKPRRRPHPRQVRQPLYRRR